MESPASIQTLARKPPPLPPSPHKSEPGVNHHLKTLRSFLSTPGFSQLRPSQQHSLETAILSLQDYLEVLGTMTKAASPSLRASINHRYFSSPKSSRSPSPRSRSPSGEQRSYQVSKILRRIRRSNNLDERLDLVLIFRRAEKVWLMKKLQVWERWAGCLYWSPAPYLMFTGAERLPVKTEAQLQPPIQPRRRRASPLRSSEAGQSSLLRAAIRLCVRSRRERVLRSLQHWHALTLVWLRMVPWVRTQAVATCQSDNCIAAYYAIRAAVQTITLQGKKRVKRIWRRWRERGLAEQPGSSRTELSRVRESHIWKRALRKSAS